MAIDNLYRMKGELVTTIEVAQAELARVNEEIAKELNAAQRKRSNADQEEKRDEKKEDTCEDQNERGTESDLS
jgi:hypothetical protein